MKAGYEARFVGVVGSQEIIYYQQLVFDQNEMLSQRTANLQISPKKFQIVSIFIVDYIILLMSGEATSPNKSENENMLKLCFPTIYGINSMENQKADNIFKRMIEYITNDKEMFSKQKTRIILKDLLTKASLQSQEGSLKVIFKCQYGCAIIFTKPKKQSPINIRVVAPDGWKSGSNSWRSKNLEFWEPESRISYYTPLVLQNDMPLQTFVQKFMVCFGEQMQAIQKEIIQADKNAKIQKSLKLIEEACKNASKFYKTYSPLKIQQKVQHPKQKMYGQAKSIVFNNSNPNTSWYVPQTIAKFLIQANEKHIQFAERLIIGFKADLLEKFTNEKAKQKKYDQKEVANIKNCFYELMIRYRDNLSHKPSKKANKGDDFIKIMKKINKNIQQITHGGLTSYIQDKEEEKNCLPFEPIKKASFVYNQKIKHVPEQIKLIEIQDYPLEVGERFPFEQLLLIGQNVQKQDLMEQGKWIMLTEKTIFAIADKFETDSEYIDLLIHPREIECEIGQTNLLNLIEKYQKIIKQNELHFGFGMRGQARSHIQLMKTIATIITFENMKLNRQNKKSKLQKYRVPIDIDKFYQQFISNSYEARRAMKKIKSYHEKRKHKKMLFVLNGNDQSFAQFGKIVAQETRSAQYWIQNKKKITKLKKQIQIQKVKLEGMEYKKNQAVIYIKKVIDSPNTGWVYHNIENYKSSIETSSTYKSLKEVNEKYNSNDPWLFAFVENIPIDILGFLKCAFIAQNPRQNDETKLSQSSMLKKPFQEKFPINPYCKYPSNLNSYSVDTNKVSLKEIRVLEKYDDIKILYDNSQVGIPISNNHFQINEKIFQEENVQENNYSFIYRPVNQATKYQRQHELYSKQQIKPQDMEVEEFLGIGNVRSAQKTQLILLCLNTQKKKIVSNSYDQQCRLAEQTFLQTAGQLSTYDIETEKHFKHIRNLIKNVVKFWAFTDVNFCPILGPFLGYIQREIFDDEIPEQQQKQILSNITYEICKLCLVQFDRGQQQLRKNSNLNIFWDQRFICTAAICCFRETLLSRQDEEKLTILCQLIFKLRTCKILSDRQEKPKNKRTFQKQLAFSVQKAIMSNIKQISEMLNENSDKISKILKKMDPSYPEDIEWQRQNFFSFYGKSRGGDQIYQINLYEGKIYKNGKQISALDKKIKQNQNFKLIFGQDREFQVFQSPSQYYLRTKNNMNHQFKIKQENGLIFFEFSEDGNRIRHIYKKSGDNSKNQEIWELIPKQIIKNSKCNFPKIFLENHLAWYSQKRKCILFRQIKFEDIYKVGLVVHLECDIEYPILKKAYYITYFGSYQNQNLDLLCDINTESYDQIILRNRSQKLQQIQQYKALCKFQKPQYVLELINRKTKQVTYFLHRYQLKFKLQEQQRLVSETQLGYSLDYSFYSKQNVIYNKFPSLVLKKYSKNPALLNNHKRIVLISKGTVEQGGQICHQQDASKNIDYYKYWVHDFFGDLRAMTRQSAIYLACIMLSINDNVRISSIQMTPLQYCQYLLNSCFSNRPLTKDQRTNLDKIMSEPNFAAPQSTVLLCMSLCKCSTSLQKILPFQQKEAFSSYQEEIYFQLCKTLYHKKFHENKIRFRELISKNLLEYIGVNISRTNEIELQSSGQDSSNQTKDNHQKWRKIKGYKYEGNNIIQAINEIDELFKQFQQQSKKLNIWENLQGQQVKQTQQLKFPKSIKQLAGKPNANIMMKQMVEQLQESYKSFIGEQTRIQAIAQKIKDEKLSNQLNITQKLIQIGSKCLQRIEQEILTIKQLNEANPDVLIGFLPTLSYVCFTKMLCYKNQIKQYFPYITEKAEQALKKIISYWFSIKTRIASLQRIQVLLRGEKLDVVSLMREVLSPRQKIQKKPHWLAFQAENKVQLWQSQLQTYNRLMDSDKKGPFCQLNMGQGKTQVIIPMIILSTIFEKKNQLPRINLLSSLMEEARGNFFRFISVTGFQIPGFQLPFTRVVNLNKKNIYQIRDLIKSFSSRLFILMTRESRLSQILRYYETNKSNVEISMQKMPIFTQNLFDVFDEIDAHMTAVKSYIFSIGQTEQLPNSKIRLDLLRVIIQIFLKKHLPKCLQKKIAITDETDTDAISLVQKGQYPPGLRLNIEDLSTKQLQNLRTQIANDIILDPQSHEFAFMQKLDKKYIRTIIQFIVNPCDDTNKIPQNFSQNAKNQIFALRGALGYGIFEHCLSMRCGVNYGVPDKHHKKKIAVPYDAADIPSRTSQYQQPDVSCILSYLAYYTRGLDNKQFEEAIKGLLSLSQTSKQLQYGQWFNLLSKEDQEKMRVKNVNQINCNSKQQVNQLYAVYRRNRRTIAFWLKIFVFPKDLKQYKRSICSSAWDLADVKHSVGFSGTKDNHWLYSDKLVWSPCQTPSIKGTDGKMLYSIVKYTNDIQLIQEDENVLWQRFVNKSLANNVGAIIDAGALCVGKSLQKQIVPWIAEHEKFDKVKYQGILFCDSTGKWKVYDIESKHYIGRGTNITDDKAFVIFDEARTRGADIKMDSNVVAAISLGPSMTKDKFMQAAGRLRKLGRNQRLIILATHQIFASFENFPKKYDKIGQYLNQISKTELSSIILAWCCKNSIDSNEKLLIQFANLGWNHIKSKVNRFVHENQIECTLRGLYESSLEVKTVQQICNKMLVKIDKNVKDHQSGKQIVKILTTYGCNVIKQTGTLDDVCERQVEAQKQRQKQQQDAFSTLSPIPEKEKPLSFTKLPDIPLTFGKKFLMTQNFIETTESKQNPRERNKKQLADIYFVIFDLNNLQVITLREASNFIYEHIINKKQTNKKIALLNDLSIEDEFITDYNQQSALVSAKFLAGFENYTKEEEEYLLTILFNSSKAFMSSKQQNFENLTSVILKKKRIYLKKYMGSTLDKMVVRLQNENLPDDMRQKIELPS